MNPFISIFHLLWVIYYLKIQHFHFCLSNTDSSGSSTHSSSYDQQKTTLIFFLGGATYAEVSALRFLSQLEEGSSFIWLSSFKRGSNVADLLAGSYANWFYQWQVSGVYCYNGLVPTPHEKTLIFNIKHCLFHGFWLAGG